MMVDDYCGEIARNKGFLMLPPVRSSAVLITRPTFIR